MKLTVIIPIYNEASTLGILLGRVKEVPIEKEILVV
ncbi:MAG TPA: glycosyl transferase, partial [Chloroflexi bacterium]|nr:glycosyl transferase [Chloroflexota bacterium]